MSKYTYTYETEAAVVEYGDLAETIAIIKSDHPGCVISDEWEPCGEGLERRLVWENPAAADSDDGSKSIGQIVRS